MMKGLTYLGYALLSLFFLTSCIFDDNPLEMELSVGDMLPQFSASTMNIFPKECDFTRNDSPVKFETKIAGIEYKAEFPSLADITIALTSAINLI